MCLATEWVNLIFKKCLWKSDDYSLTTKWIQYWNVELNIYEIKKDQGEICNKNANQTERYKGIQQLPIEMHNTV